MAPATRTSGNFGANHTSNLDHILENFNQFKRKHITQNRDIIKTNALAQLRIKELEDKILQMEGERAEKNLELIRVRANMDRVERATRSVMRGWQLVGAGLAAMAAIDGLQIAEKSDRFDVEAREMIRNEATQIKPSTRIVLDPHALPGGVARSVARAPELPLENLVEEDSREIRGEEGEEGIETVEAEETAMFADDTNDISQLNERTMMMDVDPVDYMRSTDQEEWKSGANVASTSNARYESSERIDTSRLHLNVQRDLHRATSTESLSSFADDDEVQLSDDLDEVGEEDILRSILQDQKTASFQDSRPAKSRRKRGPTMSPERSDESRSATPSQQSANMSSSEGDIAPTSRSSRRSSARDRKSINYALPKLNTKMRKPDPADLIPVHGGEERRSSSEQGTTEDGHRDATPKRTLKGGSEVASTGNLREIRKQHQSSRMEGEQAREMKQTPLTRRRSSGGLQARRSMSADDREELQGEEMSEEDETSDLSASWSNGSSSTSTSWKATPPFTSNLNLSKSAAAANGTPIPRNHSGQNIKALKVANRIQKTNLIQPTFSTDGSNNRKITNGRASGGASALGGKVLNSSAKLNQPVKVATTPNVESKRSSLHAAMTWEGQDQIGQ